MTVMGSSPHLIPPAAAQDATMSERFDTRNLLAGSRLHDPATRMAMVL